MNIFGGASGSLIDKGPRGPRGYRGKDSSLIELCTWLPMTVLENLQKSDECGAFFIQNLEKDIIRSKGIDDNYVDVDGGGKPITQWVSRSKQGGNLVAKKASSELEEVQYGIQSGYAMTFKTTHYENKGASFLPASKGNSGFICITFRTHSERHDQVLISGLDPKKHQFLPRLIKVSSIDITIQIGKATEIIQNECKEWTTLFIEYNSDDFLTHFTYDVNDGDIIGSFTCPNDILVTPGFNLGCKWDETEYLDGQIASVELYDNYDAMNAGVPLPNSLKHLVTSNQLAYDPMIKS